MQLLELKRRIRNNTKDKMRLREALKDTGMSEVRFRFEMEGAKVL